MTVRVGLNCVFVVPGETGGMEVYARALVERLAADERVQPVVFVSRAAEGVAWPCPRVVLPVDARSRPAWVAAEQLLLPAAARRAGCALVHSLASTGPAAGAFRRVTTVHDLNYLKVPEAHFGLRALGMRALVPLAARRSHRVIAISHATRRDLEADLGVPAARIDVVPQAAAPAPPPGRAVVDRVRAALGLEPGRPVVLAPGAKRPHKGADVLVDALGRLRAERPVLVVTGYATPADARLRALADAADVDVVLPGWLPDEELDALYAVADVVAVPSRYEGFGLPVLEAMVRGVPVVCSDSSSLPEVAGDAALVVPVGDAAALAGALGRLLGDPGESARLAAAGRARAAAFSWERTAALTVAVYERTLAGDP